MTDAIFPVITQAWLLTVHSWLTARSQRAGYAAAVGSALLTGFAYAVHSRGLVMLIGFVAVGILIGWRRPAARRTVAAAALTALLAVGAGWELRRRRPHRRGRRYGRGLRGRVAARDRVRERFQLRRTRRADPRLDPGQCPGGDRGGVRPARRLDRPRDRHPPLARRHAGLRPWLPRPASRLRRASPWSKHNGRTGRPPAPAGRLPQPAGGSPPPTGRSAGSSGGTPRSAVVLLVAAACAWSGPVRREPWAAWHNREHPGQRRASGKRTSARPGMGWARPSRRVDLRPRTPWRGRPVHFGSADQTARIPPGARRGRSRPPARHMLTKATKTSGCLRLPRKIRASRKVWWTPVPTSLR
jgi:hypothetical protein